MIHFRIVGCIWLISGLISAMKFPSELWSMDTDQPYGAICCAVVLLAYTHFYVWMYRPYDPISESCATPNGGTAPPCASANATEGPPSVSLSFGTMKRTGLVFLLLTLLTGCVHTGR